MKKKISAIITILLLISACVHKQNEPIKGPRKLPAYNEKYIKLSELNKMKNKKKIVTYDEIVNFSEEEAMIDELIRKNERKLKEFMDSENQTKMKEPIIEKEKDFAEEKNIIEIKDEPKSQKIDEQKLIKQVIKKEESIEKGSSKDLSQNSKKDDNPQVIEKKEKILKKESKPTKAHRPVPVILKKEVEKNHEESGRDVNEKKPSIEITKEIKEPKEVQTPKETQVPSKQNSHSSKEIKIIKKIDPRVQARQKGVSLGEIIDSGNARHKRHSEPVTLIPSESQKRRNIDYLIQEERGRYSDERTQSASDVDLERDAYRDY